MAVKKEENWLAIKPGYDCYLMLPASKATEFLACVTQMKHNYRDGEYVWELGDREPPSVQIIDADLVTAARVAAKFESK
jgi:hypothetical protein